MTAPESAIVGADAAPRWWVVAAVVLLVIAIHVAGRTAAYCSPLKHDSYIYAGFGYRIAHGDAMYRDMSDIKPPGLFYLLALGYLVLPGGREVVVPTESIFLLLAYYAIYRLARGVYDRAIALMVTVVAVITLNYFMVSGHVIEGFGLAENFMVLPAVAAVCFYRVGLHQDGRGALVLCGLFLGLDTTIKQTALPVVAAIGLHWTAATLVVHRSPGRWLRGVGWMAAGGLIAWGPILLIMCVQGTLGFAWSLLTEHAAKMVGRSSALPDDWREILPLQWVLIALVWSLLAIIEYRLRSTKKPGGWPIALAMGESNSLPVARVPDPLRSKGWGIDSSMGANRIVQTTDLTLLLLWALCEVALLSQLPLRSAHYYVVTCVPIIVLAGLPFAVLRTLLISRPARVRLAAWSIAVIGLAAWYRPVVNAIVPTAIARYQSFDWEADRKLFNEAIHWGRIHFGRGQPWVETPPADPAP